MMEDLNLTKEQVALLKNAFIAFDHEKKGCIGIDMIGTILELLGHAQTQSQLEVIIKEVDVDGMWGKIAESAGELWVEGQVVVQMTIICSAEGTSSIPPLTIRYDLVERRSRKIRSGELEFEEFCILASKFLSEEDEDTNQEMLTSELKEAFRFYDKEGNGYITTDDFVELLRELDPDLGEREIQGIVTEIDQDGSGTVDFEEFVKALR